MQEYHPTPGRHLADGIFRVFLSRALLPLTGLFTAIFLSRRLGPEHYGLFSLAALLISHFQFTATSLFARATIKLAAEADDWRPLGTRVLHLHLLISGGLALLLWLLAPPIAELFGEMALTNYLRLFAPDILLFALAHVHLDLLAGIGAYRQQALAGACRWIGRLVLIVLLVELGFSIPGAIVGCIGASAIELAVSRYYVRPPLFACPAFPASQLWNYAAPLFLTALSLRLLRLDLFILKALGGTAAQAGYYSAALNLAILPSLVGMSAGGLLLSTLTRLLNEGKAEIAGQIVRQTLRGLTMLFPFAAMTAGLASEVVELIYGTPFVAAGSLLAKLIFSSLGLVVVTVSGALITAAGKPRWPLALAGPLVPLALIGHLLLIPRMGAEGAALVSALVASAGAAASVGAVYRLWGIYPPLATQLRSLLICGLAFGLSVLWQVSGFLVLFKLLLISCSILLAYRVLGEWTAADVSQLISLVRPSPKAPEH